MDSHVEHSSGSAGDIAAAVLLGPLRAVGVLPNRDPEKTAHHKEMVEAKKKAHHASHPDHETAADVAAKVLLGPARGLGILPDRVHTDHHAHKPKPADVTVETLRTRSATKGHS
mmetsp:Transcript_8546/g.24529  ORF Transcript_8546/g.24529 Transcript_8546/m.24529 type:complete len:114 (+) Transcript_8546:162-503(+)|eukprot:CAMPEP_0117662502 /NCGR_PEP_ID=MMETSP0804-20121206/8085_1 /TAXON_ID=1074897 /ORGANISM="Tetraselmis astigmatica, Strain CCMP880" /LENGTH=113 /DNA_ID=CAMNT_0005469401 /DNA_START=156 /DNA_END=497 /DNA_ORIENTATION=+